MKKTHDEILQSADFRNQLASLNQVIVDSLTAHGEAPVINGNVLYSHKQDDFLHAEPSPLLQNKRQAFVEAMHNSECLVELGVAGGHGILLALHANSEVRCIGIDLAERLRPTWPAVDIYVPEAFEWFAEHFPDRVKMIRADAIAGLRQVAEEQPFGCVDAVHLDAGKNNRWEELSEIWPVLSRKATLIQGDARNGKVRDASDRMIRFGLARSVRDAGLFQVLDVGEEILASSLTLADLDQKRVLLCVAHQDDETLFAGHFLNSVRSS